MSKAKKKILILGKLKGANRCEDFFNNIALLKQEEYEFSYFDWNNNNSENLIIKIFFLILQKIINTYFIITSDIIFYLAMNNKNLTELALASVLGKRIVVDIYTLREDIVSENRQYAAKPVSTVRTAKFRKIDEKKLTYATDIIYVTLPEKEYIERKHPIAKNKEFHIIPASQDLEIFNSKIRKSEVAYYNLHTLNHVECLNLSWWGQMSYMHNFEYIFEELLQVKDIVKLCLFDPNINRVEQMKKEHSSILANLEIVDINTKLTFRDGLAPFLLRNTDVSLGMFGSTELATKVAPNKVLESCILGIPCVTRKTNSYAELNFGDSVIEINPEPGQLAKCLRGLFEDKERRILPARNEQLVWEETAFGFSKERLQEIING